VQSDDLNRVDEASARDGGADPFADFWAPDPHVRTWADAMDAILPRTRRPVSVARARTAAAAVALIAAVLVVPQSPAWAALPSEPAENLDSLRERAGTLSEEYQGELRDMEGVIDEAERAEARADSTREEVEEASAQVRALAVASYTGSGIDPSMSLFVDAEPDDVIDRAIVVDYLSTSNQDKIDQLNQALSRDEAAQENAAEQLEEVETDLDELDERRREVQRMIADYPVQEMGGQYNITPRTEQMRELVIEEFGEGRDVGGVGCYRAVGGWVVGEHPKGRACDFMVDANGSMPPQDQIDRGWAIAEWARENAEDLGIMYVIYRQQIWDVRRGDTGWRDMADRGSITENHFDHVHISMF
jgi:septal ring factor EnvC (AmiA/AmiB activator)